MNYRIFVEKKKGFNTYNSLLKKELEESLLLEGEILSLRLLNIYDLFNLNKEELELGIKYVLSDEKTDSASLELDLEGKQYIPWEFLPGQFDQRADSAEQCMKLLGIENKDIKIVSGQILVLDGTLTNEDMKKIEGYMINPIETRKKNLDYLELNKEVEESDIKILEGFIEYDKEEIEKIYKEMNLAMTKEDLLSIQKYFISEERDPTETELRVLDTYWSDHCRHTTFETIIRDIQFPKGNLGKIMMETYEEYLEMRKELYKERKKEITLMDMATIVAKSMKKKGLLEDLELSEEINACSVYIDVDIDEKIEKWLLMFKNETHNHPTEIEPFGGASTCIGGAIRDPLSGRSYIYQAIRVTGAGDPLEKIEDTIKGKLPQKKITLGAARGYSSYGNQIGVATSHVAEIYHPGYKAKRMEVGAVVGAVPANHVRRESPVEGDLVILVGGKTGRDGCGGATGSSKEHREDSIERSSAEVQKGNAPEERKIQKLFRKKEVARLIKKCNDFGAGGVSVAIGELADGLVVDLDNIPVKYNGISGMELAISESQERMAVVVDKEDGEKFIQLSKEENLLATVVAVVTEEKRLVIKYKGEKIVDISRKFLDTNGVRGEIEVEVEDPSKKNPFLDEYQREKSLEERILNNSKELNTALNKGLVEMFDSTIGSGTILMPFGGKYQLTPTEQSIQKIPVLKGYTDTASIITWGYNPRITEWSPYHGGIYAVIESLGKVVACGGDYSKVRLSFQEYFERLGKEKKRWGKPLSALLGTISIMKKLGIPAIGGKDSMSGSFKDLDVPPTLISFAVTTVKGKDVISPEFKKKGSKIYIIKHNPDSNFLPNTEELIENYKFINKGILEKKILSAMTIKVGGVMDTLFKMGIGNMIGFKVNYPIDKLFKLDYGSFIIETDEILDYKNAIYIGDTLEGPEIQVRGVKLSLEEILEGSRKKLNGVFPEKVEEEIKIQEGKLGEEVKVFVPAFPGTNCEYDTLKAFENEGAIGKTMTFRNNNTQDILESIEELAKGIDEADILAIPGGFSAGDEPDGSAKFIATILRNEKIKKSIDSLLKRKGLIIGICNGFQALVKSGLLPYGTLTHNTIHRHISKVVSTRIENNNSPWLNGFGINEIHNIAISHGEGRFVVTRKELEELIENKQIATRYVDLDGNPTMDGEYNPNGSIYAIEGIISKCGQIFGKMGHSERKGENLYKNIPGNKDQNCFKNAINHMRSLKKKTI